MFCVPIPSNHVVPYSSHEYVSIGEGVGVGVYVGVIVGVGVGVFDAVTVGVAVGVT